MRVNFMGVVGPQGVLPIYYTELVMDRLRAKDSTLRDFLDIFTTALSLCSTASGRNIDFKSATNKAKAISFLNLSSASLASACLLCSIARKSKPKSSLLRWPLRATSPNRARVGIDIAGSF